MKPIAIIFALLLVALLAATLIETPSTSAFQSPLISSTPEQARTSQPAFQSPLATPTFRSKYVGRELILTQEAQYVVEVAATRSAVATQRAATPASGATPRPSMTSTPNP